MERDRKCGSVGRKIIAGQAFFPREAVMCTLGSTLLCQSGRSAPRLGEIPSKRSPFRGGSPLAIPAGGDSGANLSTPAGKEEGGQAEEASKRLEDQRAARTLH